MCWALFLRANCVEFDIVDDDAAAADDDVVDDDDDDDGFECIYIYMFFKCTVS